MADTSGPAAYSVALEGTSAKLTPLFGDSAAATAANGPLAGKATTLGLTDPDSNTQVPDAAPRFKNSFMLDAQAARQLIFASNPGSGKQALQVLSVAQPLDDWWVRSGVVTAARRDALGPVGAVWRDERSQRR